MANFEVAKRERLLGFWQQTHTKEQQLPALTQQHTGYSNKVSPHWNLQLFCQYHSYKHNWWRNKLSHAKHIWCQIIIFDCFICIQIELKSSDFIGNLLIIPHGLTFWDRLVQQPKCKLFSIAKTREATIYEQQLMCHTPKCPHQYSICRNKTSQSKDDVSHRMSHSEGKHNGAKNGAKIGFESFHHK